MSAARDMQPRVGVLSEAELAQAIDTICDTLAAAAAQESTAEESARAMECLIDVCRHLMVLRGET